MITYISNIIVDFLCKKRIINEQDKDVYKYGYEIIISTIIGFTLILLLGVLMQELSSAIVFLITFSITRLYCGGYHTSTYLRCNLLFCFIFICVVFLSNILTNIFSIYYLILFLLVYVCTILRYAPIDNENKPLFYKEKVKYRRTSIIISIIWTSLSIIFYFTFKTISIVASLSLFMISILMVAEKIKREEVVR